ncbi:MAG: cyclic pyranopterin phosphate synthase MoaA [Sphingobacteriales bacterium BACL12 MAG-120813-bin55]|jgi:GTP 3',8-cyclase|nr:MAG: cyclic pyranopterin phosphate synthase MoaA [Sphingobacteriales bacterium BACL12 MAG-120813-bin55]
MLKDTFGRQHDYLRISLTDNCNFRCAYCMPDEEIDTLPEVRLMQADEIFTLASIFTDLGVKKIRLTGGEPLIRKDAAAIMERLSSLPVELTITSNAFLADRFISTFRKAGMRSLNVSLDTLHADKFVLLTRRDKFQQVWNNIQLLLREGFRVKLNCVVMKGVNSDEICQFVELTKALPLHVRFIEFMPFDKNNWQDKRVFTWHEILEAVSEKYIFKKLTDDPHDTAKKYRVPGHMGTFAVISTMSAPFCSTCNRMRLTADGKMKNCLFSSGETDLLQALRRGEDVEQLIRQNILDKKEKLGGQMEDYTTTDPGTILNRTMISIGG